MGKVEGFAFACASVSYHGPGALPPSGMGEIEGVTRHVKVVVHAKHCLCLNSEHRAEPVVERVHIVNLLGANMGVV